MAKIRKQTFSLGQYLKLIKAETIRTDQECQRLSGQWNCNMETRALFDVKHTHIFVAAFKAFVELGRADEEFNGFLHWFVNGGNETEIDGKTWDMLNDRKHSTRDISIVHGKLDCLVSLMGQYFKEEMKAA